MGVKQPARDADICMHMRALAHARWDILYQQQPVVGMVSMIMIMMNTSLCGTRLGSPCLYTHMGRFHGMNIFKQL